jgi:hypothetical protein
VSDFTAQLAGRGLRTAVGLTGQPEQDGLRRADNVVMNSDGLWELRRGLADYYAAPGETFDRLGVFGGLVASHTGSGTLRLHNTSTGATVVVPKSFANPTEGEVLFAEMARCLYVRHAGGVDRLDAPDGTPRPAGVAAALDAEATLVNPGTDGQAVAGDSQVAYRAVFGVRDANGRLILGAPSGRAVVRSMTVLAPVGSLSRTGTTVTASITAHGFVNGERIVLTGSDPAIANGTYTITSVGDANHFTFTTTASGTNSNTVVCRFLRTTRDVSVGATIPPGATSVPGTFCRFYRSLGSVADTAPPSDEMGLVSEVTVPSTARVSTLERTGSTVTAVTEAVHGISAGSLVRLTGLAGASGQDVAVGLGSGYARATTPGGAWGTGALSGDLLALAWSGTAFCAVGDNAVYTSPTGVTWTARTPAVASRRWTQLAYSGSRFLALSPGFGTRVWTLPTGEWIDGDPDPIWFQYAANTDTSAAATGAWQSFLNVQGGSTVSVYCGQVKEYNIARSATVRLEYRVNNGSWTALGTDTRALTANGHFTASLGTVPVAEGTIDLRVRTEVASCPSWPAPTRVWDKFNQEYIVTAYTASLTVETMTVTGSAPKAQTSTDGASWTEVTLPSGEWGSLCYDGSRFVIAGTVTESDGTVRIRSAISSDTSTWVTGSTSSVYGAPYALASDGAGRVVAVSAGFSAHTTDGTSWTAATTAPAGGVRAVGFGSGYFVAVGSACSYRSTNGVSWVAGGAVTGELYGVTADGSTLIAVGTNVSYSSADAGASWSSISLSGSFRAVAPSPSTGIPGGTFTIIDTPSTTSFRFTSGSGTIATTSAPQDAVPVTVGLVDTVPSGMLGESAYWNATQEGALASHDLPPDCLDMAVFRDHLFFAAPKRAPVLFAALLKVGTGGLTAGDVVTLPAGTVVAAAAENPLASPPAFGIFTDGDSGSNINRTAASLVRVINRNASQLGCTAVLTSTQADPSPGGFALISPSPSQPVSVAFTAASPGVWSPAGGGTETPKRDANTVAYSLPGMPDSVPTLNTLPPVGSADEPVLRVVPLRDSALLLKRDGAFRLTGYDAASWSVQPLDPTFVLVGPNTAVAVPGACIALSSRGLVVITDAGVELLSGNVQDQLDAVLTPAMRDATSRLAFGVSYDTEATYLLWVPASPSSTLAERALVLHTDKGEWTARTDARRAALVLPSSGRLYAAGGSQLSQERKTGTLFDYADGTRATGLTATARVGDSLTLSSVAGLVVGDVLVQGSTWDTVRAISGSTVRLGRASSFTTGVANITALAGYDAVLAWAPRYAPQAGQRQLHAREVDLSYRDAIIGEDACTFSSDADPVEASVPVLGSSYALSDAAGVEQPRVLRVLVPRQHARSTRLYVTSTHRAGYRPVRLEAMTCTFNVGTERTGK